MEDPDRIKHIIRIINDAWYHQDYQVMEGLFSDSVIFRSPDFKHQIQGKEVCIQTFRDFMNKAIVSKFEIDNISVNFLERTALATYQFIIEYEMNNKFIKESGTDIIVFEETEGNWLLSWRAMCNLKTE